MHEHIQVSLLVGRRTKGNVACFLLIFADYGKKLSAENLPLRPGRRAD